MKYAKQAYYTTHNTEFWDLNNNEVVQCLFRMEIPCYFMANHLKISLHFENYEFWYLGCFKYNYFWKVDLNRVDILQCNMI